MIKWVAKKSVDLNLVNNKINECIDSKCFTNGGKNVLELQLEIKKLFKLDENKSVLMVCNGAMGLNALVGGFNIQQDKKLKWVVQSFTFPCCTQGNLIDSLIFDIDENMGPNIKDLIKHVDKYDGVVITNCFGTSTNIELYEKFCFDNKKILIFDNAASPFTFYKNKNHLNYGNACMVSLHHTKPIGFGEGGFIVFDNSLQDCMEKSICFGYTKSNRLNYNIYANNFKMSEIACIYISEYIKNLDSIINHHCFIIKYFIKCLNDLNNDNIKMYKNYSDYTDTLLSTIPILFEKPTTTEIFTNNNIEAKKYYFPIGNYDNIVISKNIFDRIICLPINMETTTEIIDFYISIIKKCC